MIELTPAQRRDLRARAHHLNPVAAIAGNGLTDAVLAEIERALQAHELIKVRVYGTERDIREALMSQLCAALQAAPVQHIGNILVVWRERREEAPAANATAPRRGRAARPSTAKSAGAFAATARRAALKQAAEQKRTRTTSRPGAPRPYTPRKK
ncbi:YhbY family RNA-binding protein [Pseudothauera nasutitermitis]|uniref:YhbY family RNA-binding protein n=1 Tax=Pseudothauera nasutitermitis TaxID=2565930 RepID=A0A4S4B2L6_9RHOO|nr:YhbY family RNA-binding protein [Pseudothauera nasutitermitis]THF66890.1 YhbY family RNA-binding protein [Pseudothauera nasutitermitis]